jgi:uncharacterized protein YqgQ
MNGKRAKEIRKMSREIKTLYVQNKNKGNTSDYIKGSVILKNNPEAKTKDGKPLQSNQWYSIANDREAKVKLNIYRELKKVYTRHGRAVMLKNIEYLNSK